MKKQILWLVIISCTLQNVWDNLYSNNNDTQNNQDFPQNIKAFLEIEDSYLFSSINIALDIDPIQNTFYFNLLYNNISIGELKINFNKQSFILYSKRRGCFKTKFPSIFKFSLGNIHNLWKFSTLNTKQNQYQIDLNILGMDRSKIPETILFYKDVKEGKQILEKIQMIFITQKMILKNKLVQENQNDIIFSKELNEKQFCVEFSFKQLRKKFQDIFLSDLINKIYEKLIGYQNKIIGNKDQIKEN